MVHYRQRHVLHAIQAMRLTQEQQAAQKNMVHIASSARPQ